jgi:hypothetical protein
MTQGLSYHWCECRVHGGCRHMGTFVVLARMTFPGQLKGDA